MIVYTALLSLVQPLIVQAALIETEELKLKLRLAPVRLPVQPTTPPVHPEANNDTAEFTHKDEPDPEITGIAGLYLTNILSSLLCVLKQRFELLHWADKE